MYSVRKFPNIQKDEWIALNRDRVEDELKNYEGMFDEPLKNAFEEVLRDYIFLSNTMTEVIEWKQDFARFLGYAVDVDEHQTEQRDDKESFHAGRLSMIKEILEWF